MRLMAVRLVAMRLMAMRHVAVGRVALRGMALGRLGGRCLGGRCLVLVRLLAVMCCGGRMATTAAPSAKARREHHVATPSPRRMPLQKPAEQLLNLNAQRRLLEAWPQRKHPVSCPQRNTRRRRAEGSPKRQALAARHKAGVHSRNAKLSLHLNDKDASAELAMAFPVRHTVKHVSDYAIKQCAAEA